MEFANPEKNLKQFGLIEGQIVADLGAGAGSYAISAASMVGNSGKVYAVEVQKDLVTRVQSEVNELGLSNLEVRWGDIETLGGTKLRDNSVDVVLLSNILFQVEDGEGLANEVARILRPGGRMLIVDWDGSYDGLGPSEEAIIPELEARRFFENKGYVFEASIKAGTHHYGFSMAKV